MSTLPANLTNSIQVTSVRFIGNTFYVGLSDGRELSVPLEGVPWLHWLLTASDEQRAQWVIEPGGYAIYWENLDDGVEICRLLSMTPLG